MSEIGAETRDTPVPEPGRSRAGNLVCPACHGPLQRHPDALSCGAGCGSYPLIEDEVPDFLSGGQAGGSAQFLAEHETGYRLGKEPPGFGIVGATRRFQSAFPKANARLGRWLWNRMLEKLQSFNAGHAVDGFSPELEETFARTQKRERYRNPFNFYLQAMAVHLFGRVRLEEPSMEYGGNYGHLSNLVYGGRQRINFGVEYLAHSLREQMDPARPLARERHEVFDQLAVGSFQRLPFADGAIRTGIAMHILDHVIPIHETLAEIARVLAPGGRFYATTYAEGIYRDLPDVVLMRRLGLFPETYFNWRLRRINLRRNTAYVREGAYPTGQNRVGLDDWRRMAADAGLHIVETIPYNFRIMDEVMDLAYQGFECPEDLWPSIDHEFKIMCQREVDGTPGFDETSNVLLVFERMQ